MEPPWKAALTLRWTILRRRYLSPLEAVILLVVTGLSFLVGKALADASEVAWLCAGLTVLGGVWVVAQFGVARQLLYGARELTLLVPSGLRPRTLVRLRLLELCALNAVAILPPLALLIGFQVTKGNHVSPALALAPLVFAPAIASLALIGGWLRHWASALALFALVGLGVAAGLDPQASIRALAHPFSPGGALAELVQGDLAGAGAVAGLSVALPLFADRLVAMGFARGLDRAAQRPVGRQSRIEPVLRLLLLPLGHQANALLRRDVLLFLRGGFVRGIIILSLMPLALAVVPILAGESATNPFQLKMASLLVIGIIAAGSGFLFGVDFPRTRRNALLLERTQPLRAFPVLLSRWTPAAAYGALIAAGCALLIATLPHGEGSTNMRLIRQAAPVLGCGVLLALIASHHAVTYGMRSEAQLDPAEAAAYPLNGGFVVIIFAFGILVSPWLALAYPVLWFGFSKRALRRWETAEVESMHQAAA